MDNEEEKKYSNRRLQWNPALHHAQWQSESGNYLQNETIWLTQQKIADLFGVDRTVATKHIGNIFKSSELDEQLVCANFAHTTPIPLVCNEGFAAMSF